MLNTVEPLIPHSSARRDNLNFSTSCRYIVETGRQRETEKERERERFGWKCERQEEEEGENERENE